MVLLGLVDAILQGSPDERIAGALNLAAAVRDHISVLPSAATKLQVGKGSRERVGGGVEGGGQHAEWTARSSPPFAWIRTLRRAAARPRGQAHLSAACFVADPC